MRLTLGLSKDPAPGVVHLRVEGAGPGFDREQVRKTGGLGLLSMQERARSRGTSRIVLNRL